MKITSNIFHIGGPMKSHPSDACLYLIKSDNEAALVDAGTGEGTDIILNNLETLLPDLNSIKYIFITHCHYDHTGGAGKLRELTGASIVSHKLAALFLESGDQEVTAASWYRAHIDPLNIDIKATENKTNFNIGSLDATFYHTPGHSPGSSVLITESDQKKILFGQDIHGPLNSTLKSNRKEYTDSLEFLLTLEADILCEGHFGVISGKEKVKRFIESYL